MDKLWKDCSAKEKRAVNRLEEKARQNHKNYREGLIGDVEYENVKTYLLEKAEEYERKYNDQ